jgi:putative peptide zinc metalloprotease protein
VRPERFLTTTYEYIQFVYRRAFALTIITLGLVGIYIAARQWDKFFATFVDLLSIQGAIYFGITLSCLKVIHELGHAYTAKRYGCRVPNMGFALLVLVPVLYTDVNDAWKLTSRKQRLAIGLAGVSAELCCAAVALFLWGFLPDGPTRSAAFLVATSTWLTTVLLNLSPFMRYDGYYVLSDWLEMPNLHSRAFAMGRWWLREKLLDLGDEPPEYVSESRQRFMVAFAFLTWAYRLSLFLAIAAIVYAFVIKILGVAMAAVEVGFFLLWPVIREVGEWWKRRADVRLTPRTALAGGAAIVVLVLLIVPWRTKVEAPAVIKSAQHVGVFVPEFGARLVKLNVASGQIVQKGELLAQLVSPDIEFKLHQARAEVEILQWQISARGADAGLLEKSLIAEQQYGAALAEYRSLSDQLSRLDVVSPFAGRVVDLFDGLERSDWLPAKTRLMSVVDPAGSVVEAYVDEADLDRISAGQPASFFADADSRTDIPLKVREIASASTRVLGEAMLASSAGGPIAVRPTKQNTLVPDRTLYRVTLSVDPASAPPDRMLRGVALLEGRSVSLISRAWRAVLAVLIRESGA